MKTLRLFLILIFSLSCSPKLAIQETLGFPVKVKEVYFQKWIAGIQGGGSGITLHIEFSEKLPKELVLNYLYFRHMKDSVRELDEENYTVTFPGTANWEKENEPLSGKKPKAKNIEAPIKILDNEAILEFTQNGKRKLFKIKNITEKEMLAYPSARPRN
jgi:hypothetical protein